MIFGTTAPKFIFDPTGAATAVLLDYVNIIKDEPEEIKIMHESVFTGHREFVLLKKYWVFELKLHLYKYANPINKYAELKTYEGSDVRLYRHSDGNYIETPDGVDAVFFLETIDESYYQTPDYKDLLFLRFVSNNYTDLSQGI